MIDDSAEKKEKEELIKEYQGHPHEVWGCDRCRLQTVHIKTIEEEQDIVRWKCLLCGHTIEKKIVEKTNHIAVRKRHYDTYNEENT